jgi:hypothetical protein
MHVSNIFSDAVAAPENGMCYTKEESVCILSTVPAKERTPIIDDWIESGKIPCQRSNMYKLLNKFIENPKIDLSKTRGFVGRHRLLSQPAGKPWQEKRLATSFKRSVPI